MRQLQKKGFKIQDMEFPLPYTEPQGRLALQRRQLTSRRARIYVSKAQVDV